MLRRHRAFTLVELLVVIGIIAVLIAILLPTLAGARRSAATVKCAAHLRDLGNAIQMYANESGQYIPTIQSVYSSKFNPMWYDQLGKYVFKGGVASVNPNAPSVMASLINDNNFARTPFAGCPAYEFARYENNPLRSSTGYGLNLYPTAPATVATSSGLKLVRNMYPATSSAPSRFFKLVEMRNPTNRALMADANGYAGLQANDPDPILLTPRLRAPTSASPATSTTIATAASMISPSQAATSSSRTCTSRRAPLGMHSGPSRIRSSAPTV
jgi:prepilin-type N-terminal cleavage/methylation domain-containing protein